MKTKNIKTSRINISAEMKSTMPRPEKLVEKYVYTRNQIRINRKYCCDRNIFHSPIVIDKRNNLIDGYISYLIAKMFDIKKVDVFIQEE